MRSCLRLFLLQQCQERLDSSRHMLFLAVHEQILNPNAYPCQRNSYKSPCGDLLLDNAPKDRRFGGSMRDARQDYAAEANAIPDCG